ncbi:hypothetical protein BpHYR1_003922 [Brachionus plicatilis]|uniref:Uncharacterized protein n=1 Tax=Brachionus plicatilis TaxID=10195 RepID=A0A3M7REJ3_BRAPC|nr:hypothetical protein BpHYR1_003922 [Brachionus plicatilis]
MYCSLASLNASTSFFCSFFFVWMVSTQMLHRSLLKVWAIYRKKRIKDIKETGSNILFKEKPLPGDLYILFWIILTYFKYLNQLRGKK